MNDLILVNVFFKMTIKHFVNLVMHINFCLGAESSIIICYLFTLLYFA